MANLDWQPEVQMQYVAFYEDRAKINTILSGAEGGDDGAHEVATQSRAMTTVNFCNLDDAVEWAASEVAAGKTFYGMAEVREFEWVPKAQRCRYCTCSGERLIRHHLVAETGIEETHEDNDECAA